MRRNEILRRRGKCKEESKINVTGNPRGHPLRPRGKIRISKEKLGRETRNNLKNLPKAVENVQSLYIKDVSDNKKPRFAKRVPRNARRWGVSRVEDRSSSLRQEKCPPLGNP